MKGKFGIAFNKRARFGGIAQQLDQLGVSRSTRLIACYHYHLRLAEWLPEKRWQCDIPWQQIARNFPFPRRQHSRPSKPIFAPREPSPPRRKTRPGERGGRTNFEVGLAWLSVDAEKDSDRNDCFGLGLCESCPSGTGQTCPEPATSAMLPVLKRHLKLVTAAASVRSRPQK